MSRNNIEWESVIGLEVHVQLATKSKIFSGASTSFGSSPNTQACNIDLGMPGVLPVLNEMVLKMAVKFGLAIKPNYTQLLDYFALGINGDVGIYSSFHHDKFQFGLKLENFLGLNYWNTKKIEQNFPLIILDGYFKLKSLSFKISTRLSPQYSNLNSRSLYFIKSGRFTPINLSLL